MVKTTNDSIKMGNIILNKDRFLEIVSEVEKIDNVNEFREKVEEFYAKLKEKNL